MKFPITKVLNCRNSKTQKKLSNILKQKAGNGEVHQISVSIKDELKFCNDSHNDNTPFKSEDSTMEFSNKISFAKSIKELCDFSRMAKIIEETNKEAIDESSEISKTTSSDIQHDSNESLRELNDKYLKTEQTKETSFLNSPFNRKEAYENDNDSNDEEYREPNIVLPEDLEVIQRIGSGTFATVYLCKSSKTNQNYALKVIDKSKLSSQSLKKYALNERKVLTTVKNPFIVSLKLSFQTKSYCYLLMDYLPGKEISSYLDEEGCFSENKARFYICECIAALHALHNKGVIHRDLKPNNIILDSEGHIKLIDFNLCKTGIKTNLQRTTIILFIIFLFIMFYKHFLNIIYTLK